MLKFLDNLKYKIKNIKAKSHVLYHPKYKIGEYQDLVDKLLYCNFQALVDFVEVECAHMQQMSENRPSKRNMIDGVNYLKWEITLENNPATKKQAEAAKIILDLYEWWTLYRVDPESIEYVYNEFTPEADIRKKMEYEDSLHELDTEKLIQLMAIRRELWT